MDPKQLLQYRIKRAKEHAPAAYQAMVDHLELNDDDGHWSADIEWDDLPPVLQQAWVAALVRVYTDMGLEPA